MFRKYTQIQKRSNFLDNKGFSLIEVMVAMFVASLIIFSVVETYRYVLNVTYKSRKVSEMLNVVKGVYNEVSLSKIKISSNFHTNVNGIDVWIYLTNTISKDPLVSDMIIFATNNDVKFSVITSIY